MDVLNALVTMIGKPRVSLYAQEALLVALNMCDKRIEKFILIHTTLIKQVIADLCKRFQAALDAANESLSMPISSYGGSLGSVSSSLTAGSGASRSSIAGINYTATATSSNNRSTGMNASSAASSASMLSPLPKLSSFTSGSSSNAAGRGANVSTFNSPSATAVFAFARGALYGSAAQAQPQQQGQVQAALDAHWLAQGETKYSPMQVRLFCLYIAEYVTFSPKLTFIIVFNLFVYRRFCGVCAF